MLRKFLGGLVFGTGLAVAFIVVVSIWITWILPRQFGGHIEPDAGREVVTTAPPIVENNRFLGSTGSYTNGFESDRNALLGAGPGRITGRVTDGDRPVAGLRLRLALNGSVLSQWAVSGEDGRYQVPVPDGEYRLDGYELDQESANRVLAGRIEQPFAGRVMGDRVRVKAGQSAEGISLRFVVPVEMLGPEGDVSARSQVIVTWKAYPSAAAYVVQVSEAEGPHDFPRRDLFSWKARPRVTEPFLDLGAIKADLRPGRCYFVHVTAEDAAGHPISETARSFTQYAFKVTE